MAEQNYSINKGINRSIEFRGLKAQYIWYLAGGIMALMILFSIMYLIGVNTYIGLVLILIAGAVLVLKIYGMSNKYGEHGLMKALARRQVPGLVISKSRGVFFFKAKAPTRRISTSPKFEKLNNKSIPDTLWDQ